MILWACSIFYSSSSCYITIRDSGCLILPHPSYLRKLALSAGSPISGIQTCHEKYLRKKGDTLREEEKIVNLLLDEIYIKPGVSYKNGKIEGFSSGSCLEEATTVQAFMISSVFSKNKDVVALFPVKNMKASFLHDLTLKVINYVHNCGYQVLTLISDNNRVNRNMFEMLCGGKLKTAISNPCCSDKSIFLLFDTVHLLKSIRNNWLNQKDTNQTFLIPDFERNSSENVHYASILHLKKMYQLERCDYVKMSPALSRKVLYPSSFEKQNVLTAIKLFDEKTIAALEIESKSNKTGYGADVLGTKQFMEIIIKWWKIVNVKYPRHGIRLRDPRCEPVRNIDDEQLQYLRKFNDWLDKWNQLSVPNTTSSQSRKSKLSNETHFALQHTCRTLINLSEHLLKEHKKQYVLLGKFQTDNLETRFGRFRQMSGANYHVSLTQILESERKIKLMTLVKLTSSRKGDFTLKSFASDDNAVATTVEESIFDAEFDDIKSSSDDVPVSEKDMMTLVYISGYISKTVCKGLDCENCQHKLALKKELEVDIEDDISIYLDSISRGGLKWPTEFVVLITVFAFQIFKILISDSYEENFLLQQNQRSLLLKLIIDKCENRFLDENICGCGVLSHTLIERCSLCAANILLNNYCKVRNEKFSEKKSNKRKLKTLVNK